MEFTCTATTFADLRKQMLDFLGMSDAPATPVTPSAPTPATPSAGHPIPSWAPAGSTWLALPGSPQLRGPDGQPIYIDWVDGVPHQRAAP